MSSTKGLFPPTSGAVQADLLEVPKEGHKTGGDGRTKAAARALESDTLRPHFEALSLSADARLPASIARKFTMRPEATLADAIEPLVGKSGTLSDGRRGYTIDVAMAKAHLDTIHRELIKSGLGRRLDYPTLDTVMQRYAHVPRGDMLALAAQVILQEKTRFGVSTATLEHHPQWGSLHPYAGEHLNRPTLQHIKKRLTHDLVALINRPVDVIDISDGESLHPHAIAYRQQFGHVEQTREARLVVVDNTSISSDAMKYDQEAGNEVLLHYNANLAGITRTVGGAETLLMVRSARTDTPKKIEELLSFGAAKCHGLGQGLHPTDDPAIGEYRGAIVSALDLGMMKTMGTRLHGEVEKDMLTAQRRAVDTLFEGKESIERVLADGTRVRLRRPLLLELPFSGQAGPSTIALARAYNAAAAHALFQDLSVVWQATGSAGAKELAANMRQCTTPKSRVNLLTQLLPDVPPVLNPKESLAIEALKITLTGRDFARNHLSAPTDPMIDLVLLRHAFEQTGVIVHGQCKSGEDRTLTIASVLLMADMYEQKHNRACDPREFDDDLGKLSHAKYLFTRAANTMGYHPIMHVRGENGKAKWGVTDHGKASHPVPEKFYIPTSHAIGQRSNYILPT